METLRPAVFGSANPDEVALFQAAHRAGVRSEVIDRVVANGFVTHGDKQSLLESLLAAHTDDSPEMKGLVALLASGR